MDKFQNKYRIPSARAHWWDYANAGAYFITICTAYRVHYFGEIAGHNVKTRLIASLQGQIAQKNWNAIPTQFPFVELGDFVVMPNHVHGILIINNAEYDNGNDNGNNPQKTGGFAGIKNPMLNNNISRVVRWYKGACSFEIRKTHSDFQWQPRFHDHIIRNDAEYQRIVNYINTNPQNWEQDELFKS